MQSKACLHRDVVSQIPLSPSNLGSLNSAQFLGPTGRRLRFSDGTQLVRCVARYADIVVPLQDELEVTKLKG